MYILVTGCTAFRKDGNHFASGSERMAFTSMFIDANKEKAAGNIEAAIHLYEKCLKLNKKSASVHYELAGIYIKTLKGDLALKHAALSNQLDEENKWYAIRYLEILKRRNDFDAYQNTLRKSIMSFPTESSFTTALIDNLILTEKSSEAIKELDKLEKQSGIKEYTSVQKCQLYMELGSFSKAEGELQVLLDHQYSAKNMLHLADFYNDTRNDDKAFEYYQKVLAIDNENAQANFALFEYYSERSLKLKAIQYLHVAFSSESMDIDRKVKLIFTYYESSLKDSSLNNEVYKLLDIIESTHYENPKPYAVYGDFLFRDKRYNEAKAKFERSLVIDPNRYPIWKQVVLIDNEMNDFSSMVHDAEEAISYYPSDPELYWFKAVAEYKVKDYEDAIQSLNTGLAFLIDNPVFESQFHSLKGTIFNELKKYKNSDESFEQAISLDDKNALVMNNYAYYLSLRKENLDKAEGHVKQAISIQPSNSNFLDTYGWILFQQERWYESLTVLLEAYDLGGNNSATVLEHLAEVYLKLGQQEKAIQFYHHAIDKGGKISLLFEKIISKDRILEKE